MARPCKTCIALNEWDGEIVAKLRDLLADSANSAASVSKALAEDGFELGEWSIHNHRQSAHDPADNHSQTAREKLGRIARLLDENDIPLEEVGRIDKVRVGEHQTAIKLREAVRDAEGEVIGFEDRLEIVTQKADSLLLTPTWADGPEWPVVQQAAPVKITPIKSAVPTRDHDVAVILPDTQIGYRVYPDGTKEPFHDERALWIALQVIRKVRPNLVVLLGDCIDAPSFGTYEQEPAFSQSTQPSLDRTYRLLAQIRAIVPNAEIRYIEGNHDRRIQKAITNNAIAAFGLKRADAPEKWPVMSIPFLLRMDELDVEYIGGYPAGITWINDNLACIHGHKVRSAASTAAAVIDDERVSTIFGHVHRIEASYKTRRTRYGAKIVFARTPGCLSRIDGHVPSVKSSTDPLGRPVETWENWQQGLGIVNYVPGDGEYSYEQIFINEGSAFFRDDRLECPPEITVEGLQEAA